MNRKIILFLLALLITISIGLLILLTLSENNAQDTLPDGQEQTENKQKAEQPTTPDRPAGNQPGTPADKGTDKPSQPSAEPSTGAAGNTETTRPEDKQPLPRPSVKPHSKEHGEALRLAEALQHEQRDQMLNQLIQLGKLTPQVAEKLKEWSEANDFGTVEEVGSIRRNDGTKMTRYRFRTKSGQQDVLVDVVLNKDGSTTVEKAQIVPRDKTVLQPGYDAMQVSESFVDALRQGQMAAALNMVTGKEVSYATVAGICMIFEENNYVLRDQQPIRGTFENDQFAGYLVYVVNSTNPKPANIGLELANTARGWRVKAVSLDALLSDYESSAHAEGGRYFPIVKNPKGGDSLALFFAFDESTLTPRSLRQLQIVAELLKQSQGTLNISGHTDDVGSASYNQKLSERRAEAVKAALVSYGVRAEQITTHGLGKSQPRRMYKVEDTEETIDYIRGENRRAEIYLDFRP